ncbi:MAG: hypothetical protein FD125_167 [bacterium]|nr:MAG: hypothetical protein FD125_167 [bacterium]
MPTLEVLTERAEAVSPQTPGISPAPWATLSTPIARS